MFALTSAISVKSHSLNAAHWNPTASKFMEWLTSMITSREGQRYVHFCGSIYFQEYNSFWLIQWSKKNNDLIFVCFRLQMYVCEDCGHTTPEPEVHYLHLKDNHPFSPALHKFYDKRHFKFTNANFANMLLQVNS